MLVPSEAFADLGEGALAKMGAAIGHAAGQRIVSRLGAAEGVCGAPLEIALSHLAGELAIAGIGTMQVERWGRAMVVVISNASIEDPVFLGSLLGGALSSASGREVAASSLGGQGGDKRFFVGAPGTSQRVRQFVEKGLTPADVLAALQGGAS